MVINFANIDVTERPQLVLQTADDRIIRPLGYALNIALALKYNEISELTFDYPATDNGLAVVGYEELTGMRIIDVHGYGKFSINKVELTNDGIREIKRITAYSLEHEFTRKKIYIENGTYNFWNPLAPGGTILQIIVEYMPTWRIGVVDSTLIGKYRTFDESNDNAYEFIKNTLQSTYNCIFDFDTYNRTINVRDVSNMPITEPVYLSLNNLLKELTISEEADDVITCLDVNGADGVDIREVNPTGSNKIYNIDYFLSDDNFDAEIRDAWESWRTDFDAAQQGYYSLSVTKALYTMQYVTENAAVVTLNGELSSLQNLQSVYIEAIASGINKQAELNDINSQIIMKSQQIASKKAVVDAIWQEIVALTTEQESTKASLNFSNYFSEEQILALNKYFKEDIIQDSTFVSATVQSYTSSDISQNATTLSFSITDADVKIIYNNQNKELITVRGGTLNGTFDSHPINASVISASIESRHSDGNLIMSLYLSAGSIYSIKDGSLITFPSACVTVSGGTTVIHTPDFTLDPDVPGAWATGSSVTVGGYNCSIFFTRNTTEYEQRTIEWELYDYGLDCLEKVAWPSYSFSVDSINFLAIDDFIDFKKHLEFGQKIYLDLGHGKVITPLLIAVNVNFDDIANFSLEFGDRYTASDSVYSLVDMVSEGVSAGKSLDFSKFTYSAFVDSGADTRVKEFMDSALDVSKNAILSSEGQAVSWDSSGIHLRKWNDALSEYLPEQIRMINNSIVFTNDGWNSAKMAIGKFVDINLGEMWGVVAPALVGTLLAGENLVIESQKQDGSVAVFKVDASGASLHNSTFDLYGNTGGRINLDPLFGLIGGKQSDLFEYDTTTGQPVGVKTKNGDAVTALSHLSNNDEPNAKFWIDMNGDSYYKGTVYATDGVFKGTVYAHDGEFSGIIKATDLMFYSGGSLKTLLSESKNKIDADYLNLLGLDVGNGNLTIDSSGNVSVKGNITMNGGSINWTAVGHDPLATEANATANDAYYAVSSLHSDIDALKKNIGYTQINGQWVIAPNIRGGQVYVNTDTTIGNNLYFGLGNSGASTIYFGSTSFANSWGYIRSDPPEGNFRIGWPNGSHLSFNSYGGYFSGTIDFTGANVTGLNTAATFA